MSNKPFTLAVASVCAMSLASGLNAAEIKVSTTGSIASAISQAAAGDTITIDKAAHLEMGDGNIAILTVPKNLTFKGLGKDATTVQCYFKIQGPQAGGEVGKYNFTTQADVDAWGAANSITKSLTADGMQLDITGGDPNITGPALNLGNTALTATIRIFSEVGGDAEFFYYGTPGGIVGGHEVPFNVPAGTWSEINVALPALGTAGGVRLDPPGDSGKCVVSWIKFTGAASSGPDNVTFQDMTLDGGCMPSGGPRMGVNLIDTSDAAVTLTNIRLQKAGANGISFTRGTLTGSGVSLSSNVNHGLEVYGGTVNLADSRSSSNANCGILMNSSAGANINVTLTNPTIQTNGAYAIAGEGAAAATMNLNVTGGTLSCSKDFNVILGKWWCLRTGTPGNYNFTNTTFKTANLGVGNLAGGAVVNLNGCTMDDTGWAILNQGGAMNSVGTTWTGNNGVCILNNGGNVTCDATTVIRGQVQCQANDTTTLNGTIFEGGAFVNSVTTSKCVLNKPVIKDCTTNVFITVNEGATVTVNDLDVQGKCGNLFAIMRSTSGTLNVNGPSAANKLNVDPLFKNPADNSDRAIVFVRNAGGTLNLKNITATKSPATNEFVSGVNDAAAWVSPVTVNYDQCAFSNGTGGARAVGDAAATANKFTINAKNTIWLCTGFPGSMINSGSNSTVPAAINLENCTLYGGTTSNQISANTARGDVLNAESCIFDATGGKRNSTTIALSGKGNIVLGGTETNFSLGMPADTVVADAKLDPATGYLTADSKIAFAKAVDSTLTEDVVGNLRGLPAGSKADIGAYEYDQPMATVTGTYIDAALTAALMAGKSVDVVVKNGADTVQTNTYTLDADGKFVINGLAAGTYDVYAKSSHWVRAKAAGVVVPDLGDVTLNIAPVNGDSDGDNQVNLFDIVVLDQNFDTANAMADLDCSGSVNLFDYVVIDQNFGAVGEAL